MLLAVLVFAGTVAALNWLANPYKAWRTAVHGGKYWGGRFDWDDLDVRVITPYRLRTEEPTTLLVGSSRVLYGMTILGGYRDGILNASLPGASLAEIAAVLKLAAPNPHLRRVVWGVDFYTFNEKYSDFPDPDTRARLERAPSPWGLEALVKIRETLLSADALYKSRKILSRAIGVWIFQRPLPATAAAPWPEPLIREKIGDPSERGLAAFDERALKTALGPWVTMYQGYRLSPAQLSLFRETVAAMKRAGLQALLFLPPMATCELEAINRAGQWESFQRWKRDLVDVAPYWDFSGYSELNRSDYLFGDLVHMKPTVGHVILRQILGQDCIACGPIAEMVRKSGVWVDRASVDRHLAAQEALRVAPDQRASRCARVVEDLVGAQPVHAAD